MKFQIEKAIEILSQTPETVKSLLGNLSDEWIENAPNSEHWSPFDIIGHLILKICQNLTRLLRRKKF